MKATQQDARVGTTSQPVGLAGRSAAAAAADAVGLHSL